MFLDSSALVAMLALEDDSQALSERLERHSKRITSPIVVWEASIALSRLLAVEPDDAYEFVQAFLDKAGVRVMMVSTTAAAKAVSAWATYGKGRHPAALNFGDCFTYAVAREYRAPVLYKGEDFAKTDLQPA